MLKQLFWLAYLSICYKHLADHDHIISWYLDAELD